MLPKNLHELRDPKRWDGNLVHYLPYVGADYSDGLSNGVRLLLVGESHYEEADLAYEESRLYTLKNFGGYADPSIDLSDEKTFFKRVGELPTLKNDPSGDEVACAWRRIAFTNFLQRSVGERPSNRPTAKSWKSGEPALREIVNQLEPDAVLFLSASVWNRVWCGKESALAPIPAQKRDRRLWLLPHGAGEALSTWVYHPSRNFETQASRLKVLSELIRLAGRDKG